MDRIESEGLWWLPGAEQKRIPGRLNWTPGEMPSLRLIGAFGESDFAPEERRPELVYGVLRDNRNGEYVSLRSGFLRSHKTSFPGLSEQRYDFQQAFFGSRQFPFTPTSATFRGSKFQISGLNEWAYSYSGANVEWGQDVLRTLAITYTKPEPLMFTLSDATISLRTVATSNQEERRYSIEESLILAIDFNEAKNVDEIANNFVFPLRDLMTFVWGWGEASRITELKLVRSEDESKLPPEEITVVDRFVTGDLGQPRHGYDLLIPWDSVSDDLGVFISRWFALYRRQHGALELFFTVYYQDSLFSGIRFQMTVQALRLYYETREGIRPGATLHHAPTERLLDGVDPSRAESIRRLVAGNMVIGVEDAIGHLVEEHRDAFRRLLNYTESRFLERICGALHFQLHRDPSSKVVEFSREVYKLTTYLQALMQLILLSELGFDADERVRLMAQRASLIPTSMKL